MKRMAAWQAWKGHVMETVRVEQHSVTGSIWFAGWLFTIGFLHLAFWKGVLAIVLWPYYLGTVVSSIGR
jgi:uncharacterized membrane protein